MIYHLIFFTGSIIFSLSFIFFFGLYFQKKNLSEKDFMYKMNADTLEKAKKNYNTVITYSIICCPIGIAMMSYSWSIQ
jgi:hypothetical protein